MHQEPDPEIENGAAVETAGVTTRAHPNGVIPAFKEYDSCLRVERCDSFVPEHFDSGGWE
jgi:hypothetical protein